MIPFAVIVASGGARVESGLWMKDGGALQRGFASTGSSFRSGARRTEFPAYREKNRELCSLRPIRRFFALKNTNEHNGLRMKFPMQSEQGMNSVEQGILLPDSLENREFAAKHSLGNLFVVALLDRPFSRCKRNVIAGALWALKCARSQPA
jgi:hypothetical protein